MSAVEVTIAELEDCGHDEVVRVEWLDVDHSYQRSLAEHRVKSMGSFNGGLFGRLTVNRRADRSLWVVDGQHRLAMARRNKLTHVPCTVYEGWTVPQEAWVFHYKNGLSVKVSAYDQHRAGLGHLDPIDMEIEAIVAEIGGAIGSRNSPNAGSIDRIGCIDTLKRIYTMRNVARGRTLGRDATYRGPDHLRKTLHVLADAWGQATWQKGAIKPFHADVVRGMAIFLWYMEEDPNFNIQKLIEWLRDSSPQKLTQEASVWSTLGEPRSFAFAVRDYYNTRTRKFRLSVERVMGELPH